MAHNEIWFDMDGTIADLYGDPEWLAKLENENPEPYANAKPLLNLQALARVLNRLHRNGYYIGIVTWLAKNATAEYDEKVKTAKLAWLGKHLATVHFDEIAVLPYGTPKQNGRNGHLFDDEEPNRKAWNGTAHDVHNLIAELRGL